MKDARDFDEFNRVYAEFFPGNKPSRSTLQAKNMAGTRIEIEAIAVVRVYRSMHAYDDVNALAG